MVGNGIKNHNHQKLMSINTGWVNVGISHDTAKFAVESIRRWCYEMGKHLYKHATDLLRRLRR